MGTKLKPNSIEFDDGTEQTTAATNTENFTDLQDTPRDFTRSINGELPTYPSGGLAGNPVTLVGDTTNGRDPTNTNHPTIWDGNDSTYYSMPSGSGNGWEYPDESWILVSFNTTGDTQIKTKRISKIILTTGPSSHSGMGGYTFGVFGIINSISTYGMLTHSYDSTSGQLQKHPSASGVPAGEGVRREILKGTVFGSTVQGDYVQPDYRIGTGYPHKCVWKLNTPVEAQHLEFRLSRSSDGVSSSNVIGGIEIFDDADNKYVVRLNSDGTALELSNDQETRITTAESDISTLESDMTSVENRVTAIESTLYREGIVLLNQAQQPTTIPTAGRFYSFEYNTDNSSYSVPSNPSASDWKVSINLITVPSAATALILHCNFKAVGGPTSDNYYVGTSTSAAGGATSLPTDFINYYNATFAYDSNQEISFSGVILLKKGDKIFSDGSVTYTVSGYLI